MTPAGTSNELDVQNGWEENTQKTHILYYTSIQHYTILLISFLIFIFVLFIFLFFFVFSYIHRYYPCWYLFLYFCFVFRFFCLSFFLLFFFLCFRWSFVDVSLILSCQEDHVQCTGLEPCIPYCRMYVCIFIELHITVQSGPVIYSFYALLHVTHLGVTYPVNIFLARSVLCCVFFPFILDFNGRTSRGHTGRR